MTGDVFVGTLRIIGLYRHNRSICFQVKDMEDNYWMIMPSDMADLLKKAEIKDGLVWGKWKEKSSNNHAHCLKMIDWEK